MAIVWGVPNFRVFTVDSKGVLFVDLLYLTMMF